jgi:hypothetical protein
MGIEIDTNLTQGGGSEFADFWTICGEARLLESLCLTKKFSDKAYKYSVYL